MKHYQNQEKCIKKFFKPDVKKEGKDSHNDILFKTLMLNSFYSTKLQAPLYVVEYIETIEDFYHRVGSDETDYDLIDQIAWKNDRYVGNNERYNNRRNCFSFATKYCHHHSPNKFRIYDSFVAKVLIYAQFHHQFYHENFSESDLQKSYEFFHKVWDAFKNDDRFNISHFENWEIDKYLWLLGKDYFPTSKKNQEDEK